jgi:hypothetical protein
MKLEKPGSLSEARVDVASKLATLDRVCCGADCAIKVG